MHLVILTLENKPQQPPDLNLVVNNQRDGIHLADDTRTAGVLTADASPSIFSLRDTSVATDSAPGSCIASLIGKRMENTAPPPWRFCATIWPPISSTNFRAIGRPRPITTGTMT